jgi:UDP-2-acetamido-3-amino-2,3-dideoxy-glucuronate N-acetyltransferase
MNMGKDNFFAHETAVIDEGCKIGKGCRIWHFSHVMSGAILGENCNLGQNVLVSTDCVLGDNCKVQNNVSIYTGVICEEDVFMGPSMVFTNIVNPRSGIIRKDQYVKTLVQKGATIGANATIICGNTLGAYCFIGAGAVVTRDVPPYALVIGNPGKQVGWMSEYGHRLHFDNTGKANCPESGEKYELKNESVKKL